MMTPEDQAAFEAWQLKGFQDMQKKAVDKLEADWRKRMRGANKMLGNRQVRKLQKQARRADKQARAAYDEAQTQA
jgi:heme-degrading monooxygenase HmoA